MQEDEVSLSLIVATLGRTGPLVGLLESLASQTRKDLEVVIVDQNDEGLLEPILEKYRSQLRIVHVRSARGLARARNRGLQFASGWLVGFPDDDCWYDNNVVERCLQAFELPAHLDGLMGICQDAQGAPSAGRFDRTGGLVNRQNVWKRGNSTTMFCRKAVASAVGGFDETLGLGSGTRWGSGEETDFLIRAFDHGFKIKYDPTFVVRHPQTALPSANDARKRAMPYARGFVRVLRKHKYPISTCLLSVVRPALRCGQCLLKNQWPQAVLAFWTCAGRLQEFLRIPRSR